MPTSSVCYNSTPYLQREHLLQYYPWAYVQVVVAIIAIKDIKSGRIHLHSNMYNTCIVVDYKTSKQ